MGTVAWALLLCAAGLLAAAGWRRRAHRSLVICDDRGLLVRGLGLGRIPWEEIEGAYPPTHRDPEALFLRLRVTERLSRRLRERCPGRVCDPRPGEMFDVRVNLSRAAVSPVELLQTIVFRIPRTGLPHRR